MKQKIKLGIILGVEFVAIAVILILIFFAGKKSYTVTFDLNGGTLISGELEQTVTQGKSATPPVVAKDGCYLHSWSTSYTQVTRDVVVTAVWEWVTSVGFDYTSSSESNYCEIKGCFKDLSGDVYIGVYYNNKKVLGIRDNAFLDCDGITKIHMLDGILSIGQRAFAECDSLVSIELPGTLTKLGSYAFENCTSLEEVVMPEDLKTIPAGAFKNCTSLKKIVIPSSVTVIEEGAFDGCTALESVVFEGENLIAISKGAFIRCTALKEITIPYCVEVIGESAFYGCGALESVELESRLMFDIDEGDGDHVASLVRIGIKTIESGAFLGCDSLVKIFIPDTIESIGKLAFDNEMLTVELAFEEDELPDGFSDGWNGKSIVKWGAIGPDFEFKKPLKDDLRKGNRE